MYTLEFRSGTYPLTEDLESSLERVREILPAPFYPGVPALAHHPPLTRDDIYSFRRIGRDKDRRVQRFSVLATVSPGGVRRTYVATAYFELRRGGGVVPPAVAPPEGT